MVKSLKTDKPQSEESDFEFAQDESENISLLPRSAWNSQISYLKLLLKTKQLLDKRRYLCWNDKEI